MNMCASTVKLNKRRTGIGIETLAILVVEDEPFLWVMLILCRVVL